MTPTLLAILAYVVLQLLIGAVVARRIHNEQDYLVAGRSLGPWLSTFTIFATWFGAETCIGASGEAYGAGLYATTADPFGYALCLVFMGAVFAVPLWRRGLSTLADLFRSRYSSGTEQLAAVLMIPTSIMWAAAQIRAFGQVLDANSSLDLNVAITVATGVVIVYTAMGGLLADAYSDLIQGSVLLLGLVAVLAAVVVSGDGHAMVEARPESLRLVAPDAGLLSTAESWAIPVFGSVVAQELVARVIGARSPQVARVSALRAGALYLLVGAIPVALGLAAQHALPELQEREQVLAHMAARYLPSALYVVFIGALVSAILSTVDSALLVAGSLFAHNLLLPRLPHATDSQKLAWNRTLVVACGLVAYGLALSTEGVYALVEEASALGSAGVFVCVSFALFSRAGGPRTAQATLLVGLGSYAAGAHLLEWTAPYLASLAAALITYVIGSRLERTGAPASV